MELIAETLLLMRNLGRCERVSFMLGGRSEMKTKTKRKKKHKRISRQLMRKSQNKIEEKNFLAYGNAYAEMAKC
ncbi:CLUMA_CG021053, isoform A [Clunio marinus]|uniref:CLUMA_CG021053, isoform A n=1 Tax=Clunio marinus TaxID=568069 RepID=A0A1J1J6J2_9DIPT|nr:CLUMA_CG021053, isoform A [Clunio marinus]